MGNLKIIGLILDLASELGIEGQYRNSCVPLVPLSQHPLRSLPTPSRSRKLTRYPLFSGERTAPTHPLRFDSEML